MRATLKKSMVVALAALTLGAGLVASAGPAAAKFPIKMAPICPGCFPKFPITPPPAPNPGNFPHPGFGPGFGVGLGLGLVGGAIAASPAYYPPDPCIQYVPIYDRWSNVIGQRPVNVCQ